jgi:hypothetical protein
LKGGILALRSLVAIARLPEIRMKGRTRMTSRLPTRVTVETLSTWRAAEESLGGGRRSALMQACLFVGGTEGAAQRAFDTLRYLGKGHLAVKRRKNGAADQSRAAETCEDSTTEPLYRDAATIDDCGFGAING